MKCDRYYLYIVIDNHNHIYRYVPAHDMANQLGPEKALVLPIFHAITGCDQISVTSKHGKGSAWKIWEQFPQLTACLWTLAGRNVTIKMIEEVMPVINVFFKRLFGADVEGVNDVDDARYYLLHKKCF